MGLEEKAVSDVEISKGAAPVSREILKFAASSFTGFLADYGMYSLMILLTSGLGSLVSVPLSNIVARVVSASVNYTINKRYVFKNKGSVLKTASQYFVLAACIMGGNTLFLSYMVNSLGINKYAGKLVTEITFFTLSWTAQRFVIFKKKSKGKERN